MDTTGKAPGGGKDGENFLIVIGREYGSGGRRIGKMLAAGLGVHYYDRTLLSEAAKRMGYSPDIFASKDEKRPSLLRSLLSFNLGAPTANIEGSTMSDEKIYEYQSRIIKEICSRESCVIVGRTADYVMREHPRLLSLFIHAPIRQRMEAVVRRGETSDMREAMEITTRNDRNRASYYNYYTNRESWGRASNYHLSFDSSRISDEAILATVRAMLGHHEHLQSNNKNKF